MNSTINLRINKKLKSDAQKTFKKMGLDFSSGVKVYLKEVVNTQSIPFKIRTENGFTPEQEAEMLKEADWALKHGKRYKDIRELHRDILGK